MGSINPKVMKGFFGVFKKALEEREGEKIDWGKMRSGGNKKEEAFIQ
jgi:hypothetical protein